MEREKLEKISLVDGHAHLDELVDISEVLREAKEAGVVGIIAVGVDIVSNKKILKISEENHGYVYPALGYHPYLCHSRSDLQPFPSGGHQAGTSRKNSAGNRHPGQLSGERSQAQGRLDYSRGNCPA